MEGKIMPDTTQNKADRTNIPTYGALDYRFNIAKWITIFVLCATGILGIMAMAVSSNPESFRSAKDILGMLLPVLSAWIGTIIAFYFGRENFETATNALAKQLTSEEKLKSILVKDVMIKVAQAVTFTLDKPEKNVKLKADLIDAKLDKENKERLPILDPQGRIKYMGHRSLFDKFIVQEVAKAKKVEDLSLEDMLKDTKYQNMLTGSFKTLPETSNLAEVKSLTDKITVCSDVFATEDGTINSKVLGWVTNIMVTEQCKV
jgi:hypothetical protein